MDYSLPGSSVRGILQAKYWSGLPFPPPGDLPNPGIEPTSPALPADSLLSGPQLHFTSQHLLYLDERAHTHVFFFLVEIKKYRNRDHDPTRQDPLYSVHSGPERKTSSPKSNLGETLLML